jgi:hypothetical protein
MWKEGILFNSANKILIFPNRIKINNKNMNKVICCCNSVYKISTAGLTTLRKQ